MNTNIGIQSVYFKGWRELVNDFCLKANMYFNKPKSEAIIAIIALMDLYGPDFYPPNKNTVTDRFEWAKNHLEQKVNDQRFKVFFSVHETEAWLLSDPQIFPKDIKKYLQSKI